jgi:hypothetical protein
LLRFNYQSGNAKSTAGKTPEPRGCIASLRVSSTPAAAMAGWRRSKRIRAHDSDMPRLIDRQFKCAACGSMFVRVYLFVTRAEADA